MQVGAQLDILYIGRLFPKTCVVMAKKELKYTPLLGQLYSRLSSPPSSRAHAQSARSMSLSQAVFVDRQNRQTAVATFRAVSERMKKVGVSPLPLPSRPLLYPR